VIKHLRWQHLQQSNIVGLKSMKPLTRSPVLYMFYNIL